ncbi:MAG: NAD-dependent epimerase/dehydratase family protein [Myxococcales bacterium]|nr:NAD-dependent epimerase/dehydratase family protein [Myxococcales bacterium]
MGEGTSQTTVLITGASGFVGGYLRNALLDDGLDVVSLTRAGSPAPIRGRARAVDYADPESLERVVAEERPDVIYHVAGVTKGVTLEDFRRGNVMPTENLLAATERAHPGLSRFVHISSLTAYGPSDPDAPVEEHHERRPVEHYGQSKLEAELAVEAVGDRLPWTIIRPPAVYGPGDVDNFELFRLAERRLNVFYGNRDSIFSSIHVDDLAAGIRKAAASEQSIGRGYFLCDGRPTTWGDFQARILEACGKRALTLYLPQLSLDISAFFGELMTRLDGKPRLFNRQKATMGKQSAWTCRSERARKDFDYAPRVQLEQGIAETLGWYRENGWL